MQDADKDAPVYPSIYSRAAAFLLDWAIALLLSTFITAGTSVDQSARVVVLLVTLSVYHIGSLIAFGATPGKMALRMHVADPEGRQLPPDRAILRYLIFLLTVLPIVTIAVTGLMMLADPQRRAIHDRVAASRVHHGRPAWVRDDRGF